MSGDGPTNSGMGKKREQILSLTAEQALNPLFIATGPDEGLRELQITQHLDTIQSPSYLP